MKTLNSMFISVYTNFLEPYGYKQVKKTPYFVSLVGDEIVKVISCIPRHNMSKEKGSFSIIGKITTTYAFKIDFECMPRNQDWLTLSDYFARYKVFTSCEDSLMFDRLFSYSYEKKDSDFEEKMLESAKDTMQTLLVYFSNVKDISSYIEFSDNYCLPIFVDPEYINKTSKPGDKALFVLAEDMEAYALRSESFLKRRIERHKKMCNAGYEGMNEKYIESEINEYELKREERYLEYRRIFSNNEWIHQVKEFFYEQKKKNMAYLEKWEILS